MAQDPPSRLPEGLEPEDVFRTLFSAYPDSLIVADAMGTVVLANPSAAALLGYPLEELVGMPVDALVPDAVRPRHALYRDAYSVRPRARPMGMQMELSAKRRDGTEVMVEIALSPLQGHGLPLVVAAIRGIGAYPRVKQALRRARYSDHLAQLGRLAVDARDPQMLLAQVPAIATEALQVELAIVLLLEPNRLEFRVRGGVGLIEGEKVGDRVPNRPDTPAGFQLKEGRPVVVADYRSERRFVVPQAYLDAGLTSGLSVPLLDRGRAIGALKVRSHEARAFGDDEIQFLESLSNLLATSLQRAQSEEALNHSQRLESVGQLTGGIAHDFNNLLTVIQGNLQVLEDLPALRADPLAPQLVGAATRASRRGAELTSKLLAFSRRQVLQPSAVDVKALLGSLADMLRRTVDQRIHIEVETGPAPARVLADAVQLESALLNIAINARDAMPEGGRLCFSAAPCDALPAAVRHELDDPGAADSGFVAIAVTDTGGGMLPEVRERAFEPFFTTKEAGRGTGLGLSTVYGFVKQSKGAVAIDSEPGVGTTLTLYIPHAREAKSFAENESQGDAVPAGLCTLLVEDDVLVREVVQTFLEKLGCRVTLAAGGEQALLALAAPDAVFDLLLSDVALGQGMRGTQLAAEARRRFPALSVLLMSGYSADLAQAGRAAAPAWELLRKPFSILDLARAIVRVLPEAGANDH